MPQSQQKTAIQEKSVLLDLASDTSKIAQVFPMMTRMVLPATTKAFEPLPISQPQQQQQPSPQQPIVQVQVTKPSIEFQEAESEDIRRQSINKTQPQRASSQHSSTFFLNVEQPTPYRAKSAEFLSPSKGMDEDELRRASFDGTGRRPGTGRQLPSTEHLKPSSDEYVGKMAAPPPSVPQIRTTAPERRRNSYLLRTPAFDNHVLPIKQISAPLPEQQKIYDRGHAHSRSWNPEEECYEVCLDYEDDNLQELEPIPTSHHYRTGRRRSSANDPYKRFYEEMVRLFGENLPVDLKKLAMEASQQQREQIISHQPQPAPPPLHPPSMDSLGVRQQQQFTRQVKSFDDRSAEPKAQRSPKYSGMSEKRSHSETERKQLLRQSTIDMLQSERVSGSGQISSAYDEDNRTRTRPNKVQNDVSVECQCLWDARQSLERNAHLAYQMSTDFSENSASTSFESNTESMQHDSSGGRKGSAGMLVEGRDDSGHSADTKRQKYKNLLLHRQVANNAVFPEPIPTFESVCTTGSDSSLLEPINHGASSFDSSRSEMFGADMRAELAFKSLANLDGRPMASVKPQTNQSSRLPLANANTRNPAGRASFDLRRDYSVDLRTDSVFREFVRIDPKYEEHVPSGRLLPSVSPRTSNDGRRQSLSRFRSMEARLGPIPAIRYSEDQNRH